MLVFSAETKPERLVDDSTRIEDVGIAIRHLRGKIISILRDPEMGWKALTTGAPTYKKKLYLRKKHVSVIEKSVEDVK